MCDLDVPFIKQNHVYDCWLAALTMLVKYRNGSDAEPAGHPAALQAGRDRQRERDAVRARFAPPPGALPLSEEEDLDRQRQQHQALKRLPSVGLAPNQFPELAEKNGLVPVTWPAEGKWTKDELAGLLRAHGPIWCALTSRQHVIVLKGISQDGNPIVHDPEASAGNSKYTLDAFNNLLLMDTYGMMYLPENA